MSEPTEVRLVPMSSEQRDMLVGASKTRWPEFSALVAAWDAAVPGVVDARAAAGGEAAAERSLSSRADAVWTLDDLPHLLDEPEDDVVAEIDRTAGGERPSVSLREVGQVSWCLTHEGPARYWSSLKTDGGPPGFCGKECRIVTAFVQVEREAEEGERDA